MNNTASRQAAFSSNKPKVTSRTTNTPAASTFRKRRDESRQGLRDHPQFNNGNEAGSEANEHPDLERGRWPLFPNTVPAPGLLEVTFAVDFRFGSGTETTGGVRNGRTGRETGRSMCFRVESFPLLSAGLIRIEKGILCFLL